MLIDVVGLVQTLPPGSVATEVPNYDGLVALAVQADRPILHETRPDIELYVVDQPPRLYVYRRPVKTRLVENAEDASPAPDATAPASHIARNGAAAAA
jgi:hypothetical protein